MAKKYSILIPDDLHINQRNFPSFYKFIEKSGSSVRFIKERRDWITLYGNYESKSADLNERTRVLSHLSPDILFKYSIRGVNLFKVSRAEALSRVACQEEWYSSSYPQTRQDIFLKILEENKPILMQCMAAAWDWIDFWGKTLLDEKPFTHCCVFSGSLIYQRSLIEILRYTPTKVMVMESLFTGNDYYCEEKYEPIANNCDIRHQAVFKSLSSDLNANEMDKDRMKAINKVILAKNKNVEQPTSGEEIIFIYPGEVVTIFGQVINDFSLLEYKNIGLSSIHFYKDIILEIINNNMNVVFKSHPWEEKKVNVNSKLTLNILNEFIKNLPEEKQARVKIIDNYPIEKLFSISNCVVGLNSQSLIEAAFNGLKVAQFGNAFFGKKGFTHDYDPHSYKKFVADLSSKKISGMLHLDEYRLFEEFLRRLLQGQLVSIHDSGVAKLDAIFSSPTTIGLSKKISPAIKSNPISSPPNTVAKPFTPEVKDIKDIKEKLTVINEKANIPPISTLEKKSTFHKKIKKMITHPRKFFADSKNSSIRALRHFFKP
ncbi:capsular polysaccharide export protein, LipB/KpsS family [Comamonas composti]|uniref:capsular polysaccharide export protein, LipB/KpsS family n=1 Tax=Comamonas composti TaxID=408558 RepID=UPI000418426B|nr:hypothetical protein [Comamonas composti]